MIVLVYKRTYIKTPHWRNLSPFAPPCPAHLAVGGGGEGNRWVWQFLRFSLLKECLHDLQWPKKWIGI